MCRFRHGKMIIRYCSVDKYGGGNISDKQQIQNDADKDPFRVSEFHISVVPSGGQIIEKSTADQCESDSAAEVYSAVYVEEEFTVIPQHPACDQLDHEICHILQYRVKQKIK